MNGRMSALGTSQTNGLGRGMVAIGLTADKERR